MRMLISLPNEIFNYLRMSPFTHAEALVLLAGKMIKSLDECRSAPKRHQIIKAIQEWEAKIQRP